MMVVTSWVTQSWWDEWLLGNQSSGTSTRVEKEVRDGRGRGCEVLEELYVGGCVWCVCMGENRRTNPLTYPT